MTETRNSVTRLDAKSWRIDEETGFLNVKVFPTRAGVFKYRRADGSIVRELRPPEEVFKADSLATLNNKPFTNDHPPANLSPETVKQYKTGLMGGDHRRSDSVEWHTEASATIEDPAHVDDITNRGKVEVSCGYRCDMKNESGTHPVFGKYDAIQTNIRYNHNSSVWRGRAGHGARVTQDCARYDAEQIIDDEPTPKKDNKTEELIPMSIRIDGKEYESAEAAQVALDHKFKADAAALDTAKAEAEQQKARADKAEAERDAAQAKADELEKRDISAMVKARASLETTASRIVKDVKFDGLSDRQIKEEVIKARFDWAKLDGQSDDYVNALYESAVKQAPKQDAAGDPVMDAYDEAKPPSEWGERYDLID